MRIKTKEELLALPSFSVGILIDNDRSSIPITAMGKEVEVFESNVYENQLNAVLNKGTANEYVLPIKKEWLTESKDPDPLARAFTGAELVVLARDFYGETEAESFSKDEIYASEGEMVATYIPKFLQYLGLVKDSDQLEAEWIPQDEFPMDSQGNVLPTQSGFSFGS